MSIVALISFTIIACLAFVARAKRLPAPAIACCWMIAVFIKDALFNVAMLNLKLVEVPSELQMLYLRMLNLYLLTPLIVVGAVDASYSGRRPLRRLLAAPIAVAALMAADFSMVALGAWKPTRGWLGWLSLAEAAFVYAAALLLTGRFAALLRREGVVR